MIATTDPGPSPRAPSPPASRRTPAIASPPVTTRPETPSISAGSLSRPANPASTQSVMLWSGISTEGQALL